MGRVRTGRIAGRVLPIERAGTEVVHLEDSPPPVFADPSGVRRRRLRRLSYLAGVLVFVLLVAFWLSQLGLPR